MGLAKTMQKRTQKGQREPERVAREHPRSLSRRAEAFPGCLKEIQDHHKNAPEAPRAQKRENAQNLSRF